MKTVSFLQISETKEIFLKGKVSKKGNIEISTRNFSIFVMSVNYTQAYL